MTVGPTTRFHEDCYALDMTTFYWQHKFSDCDIWDQQMRENYTQSCYISQLYEWNQHGYHT